MQKEYPTKFTKIMVNCKNLLVQQGYFILKPYLPSTSFASNVLENVMGLTSLEVWRTTKAMFMSFCLVKTPIC